MIAKLKNISKRINSFLISLRMVLVKNRIYFEILASISIIIIAVKANEISNHQISIQNKLSQPYFNIDYDLNERSVLIHTTEGRFDNLFCETVSIINLSFPCNIGLLKDNIYIRVFNNCIQPFQPEVGKRMKLDLINENDTIYTSFEAKFKEYCNDNLKMFFGRMYFDTYLKLTYRDFYGEIHRKYYDISTGKGYLVSEEYGKELFNNQLDYYYNLEKMSSDIFDKLLSENYLED